MADTPKRGGLKSPKKSKHSNPKTSPPSLTPPTPQTLTTPRRSARRALPLSDSATPQKLFEDSPKKTSKKDAKPRRSTADAAGKLQNDLVKTRKKAKNEEIPKTPKSNEKGNLTEDEVTFSPVTPGQLESKKRKREEKSAVTTRSRASKNVGFGEKKSGKGVPKRRVYYKKVVYDGGEFEVGDNVYVRRREDASSDEELVEEEECRMCFKTGKGVMIECDDCLGGFHLKCLKPPLKEVPEGDWICGFCEARELGKKVQLPTPPEGKKLARTLREKLLSSDLWAAHIER